MRSLRARLTLWVTVVLAVVLAASLGVAEHYVRDNERAAIDDRLLRYSQLSSDDALAVVQDAVPSPNRRVDAALRATGTSLRLWVGGRVLVSFGARPPARRAPRLGLQTFTSGGRRYRSDVIAIKAAGLGGLARQEVTTPLQPVLDRQQARMRRLVAVGIGALLVAALGTWLAGSVVLRPLRRLRAVTAQVAADEDLSRTVPPDDGPAEVRAVARSFNAMLARLSRSAADRERALEATRRFAADAGHELRTPLTSVQATLSTLARHPGLDAERRTAMAQDALAQQRRLV
ncbi:MAG TPA: HAMP domain-containing protein, partial [Solirubrobacteraceae bacterium]|nr:HAMP domain-containing protein [Solirubrobacteraceae bacterium]